VGGHSLRLQRSLNGSVRQSLALLLTHPGKGTVMMGTVTGVPTFHGERGQARVPLNNCAWPHLRLGGAGLCAAGGKEEGMSCTVCLT
jgi:hypothetical protein